MIDVYLVSITYSVIYLFLTLGLATLDILTTLGLATLDILMTPLRI